MIAAASQMTDLTPPQYGEHTLDRLYSDIDPSGYLTPGGPSGVGTPLNSRSRNVSTENLASMDAMASGDLAANVLQTRLNDLDAAGPAGAHRTARERSPLTTHNDGTVEPGHSASARTLPIPSINGGNFVDQTASSGGHTPSEGISRQNSEEDGDQGSPQHIEYRAEEMAKVPSYSTALRSSSVTPIRDGLPTYQAATRRSVM